MRTTNKVATGFVTVGLAAVLAACGSSSGGGGDSSSAPPASEGNSSAATGGSSSASATPVGAFNTLTGQSTTVDLDPSFVSALGQLKVTPGVLGDAKADLMSSPATLTFPITGGKATIYKKGEVTPYVQGEVDHNGSGISLTAGGKTVKLENFVIDPGNNSNLKAKVTAPDGTVVGNDVLIFNLDGTTLQTPTISNDGVATLQGTTIYLSQGAADLLNKTFGVTALKGGDKTGTKIGTAIIKATGK